MKKPSLPGTILILLAVLLYLIPQHFLTDWRLSLYSIYLEAGDLTTESDASGADHPPAQSLPEQLKALRNRIIQKDCEIASLRSRLTNIASFKKHHPRLRFTAASVLSLGGETTEGTFIIDCGRKDGIKPDDAILQGHALMGTVGRTGPRASVALLITSPASYIPAKAVRLDDPDASGHILCAAVGDGGGDLSAVFYANSTSARQGDAILTSGLLGKLPVGLLVGILQEKPVEGPEPNTMVARIRLTANIPGLNDVLVVNRSVPSD